jgi:formate hydrogenlyase transcriptional activator
MTTTSVNTLVQPLGEMPPESIIFGRTDAMQAVRDRLTKLAGANVPVLIQGESGTGKDIIARMIHAASPWRTGPWVKVNCPAIPGTLLESELFGYEKGAFTGAYGVKPGRVEMAHRGTLFLDEISELDMSLQSKLLQLLQDGQFCRIGAQEDKKVEVRVVCATNRKLEQEIENGTFRSDLFYRINVVNLHMPALRERASDIPELVEYFLEHHNRKYNCRAKPLSGEMMGVLRKYHWPGNIRELENFIERSVILTHGSALEVPIGELGGNGKVIPSSIPRKAEERDGILRILKETNGRVAGPQGAAERMGIKRTTLISRMKKLGIDPRRIAN